MAVQQCITHHLIVLLLDAQAERAAQEGRQREAEAVRKLADAQKALEEAAQREAAARRATAELQRLDKQLSARKLDAKELQVRTAPLMCAGKVRAETFMSLPAEQLRMAAPPFRAGRFSSQHQCVVCPGGV